MIHSEQQQNKLKATLRRTVVTVFLKLAKQLHMMHSRDERVAKSGQRQ